MSDADSSKKAEPKDAGALLADIFIAQQFPLTEGVPIPPVVAEILLTTHPDSPRFEANLANVCTVYARGGQQCHVSPQALFNCMADFCRGMMYISNMYHSTYPEAAKKFKHFYVDDTVRVTNDPYVSPAAIEWLEEKNEYRLYIHPALDCNTCP